MIEIMYDVCFLLCATAVFGDFEFTSARVLRATVDRQDLGNMLRGTLRDADVQRAQSLSGAQLRAALATAMGKISILLVRLSCGYLSLQALLAIAKDATLAHLCSGLKGRNCFPKVLLTAWMRRVAD
jgi:hypothetical protein